MDEIKQIIFDDDNLILQTGDAGDCAANMGTYHVFLATHKNLDIYFNPDRFKYHLKSDFESACSKLEALPIGRGLYRRHNNPDFWGSRADTMSRDQTIPLLCAWALYGMRKRAWEYFLGHLKRGLLFCTNTTPNWTYPPDHRLSTTKYDWTFWKKIKFFFGLRPKDKNGDNLLVYGKKIPDFTFAEFWALEIRSLNFWFLWPVLLALDFFTVFGSLHKVFFYSKDGKNADDRNHINVILTGLQVLWTPTMQLAAFIYSYRKKAKKIDSFDYRYYAYNERSGPQTSLDYYYRANNSPPFNELARIIMDIYF